MKLFVDTSAFVAVADHADQFHSAAAAFVDILPESVQLITSNYVLDEMITRLSLTVGAEVGARAVERIWGDERYRIHTVDRAVEEEALRRLRKYADHRLSFTDCTTLVLLERQGIERVFAFDNDFRKLGYHMVPESHR